MGKKILIVDDNVGDQRLMQEFLKEAKIDCVVSFASSGREGVEKTKEVQPDIVILDTRLPDMDGFETCRRIKDKYGEKVIVVVLTGVVDAVDAGKARQSGADGYCVKTSDGSNLLETLQEFID